MARHLGRDMRIQAPDRTADGTAPRPASAPVPLQSPVHAAQAHAHRGRRGLALAPESQRMQPRTHLGLALGLVLRMRRLHRVLGGPKRSQAGRHAPSTNTTVVIHEVVACCRR